MVKNVRNNTISEISAKKGLNILNEIKNAEIIKYKKRTPRQKELLDLFSNLLGTILTDKTLKSESQKGENENENEENENEIENENEDDENENENEDDDDDDDETMSQNKKNIIIKNKNDVLDEIIDKSKSFEEQIKSLKKLKGLKGYWPYNDYEVKI